MLKSTPPPRAPSQSLTQAFLHDVFELSRGNAFQVFLPGLRAAHYAHLGPGFWINSADFDDVPHPEELEINGAKRYLLLSRHPEFSTDAVTDRRSQGTKRHLLDRHILPAPNHEVQQLCVDRKIKYFTFFSRNILDYYIRFVFLSLAIRLLMFFQSIDIGKTALVPYVGFHR